MVSADDAGKSANQRCRGNAWRAVALVTCLTLATDGRSGDDASGGAEMHPFAPRSAPRGATLFHELPQGQTGIVTTNAYDDPRMWNERYHEFDVGAIGTGVAIGDYDGDGRPDVFVVSKVETCRLFRNLGGWKFEDVTARAGVADASGEWKQGAAFADVNNDGRLDLYVCRFAVPNLLFINQGDGTFREEAKARGLAVVDACGMAAFADFDRDGWLDVYVQTNLLNSTAHPNGQRDHLFHNNRDGTFTDVTDRAGIGGETQGHSATWWDYDEDGWPDLYVANDFGVPDFLYKNNRDGTFTNVAGQVVPHTPLTAMASDLGDVNNDGRIDFLVADMAATTHEKDLRGMAETRGRTRESVNDNPAAALQLPQSALYLNTGTGRCLEAAFLAGVAATDWTWSVRFEDLDNDGRIDLHVTNGMNREQTNADLIRSMMIAESPRERVRLMRASPVLNETHLAYRNLGDMQFEEVGAQWGLNQRGVSFGAAFGDLDGDGDLDLVFTNYRKGVTVLRNNSDSGHSIVVKLRGTASNRFGVGSRVRIKSAGGTQVRQLVLARGYLSTSEPVLHFGLGKDVRVAELMVAWPSGRSQRLTDLAVDCTYALTEPAADPALAAAAAAPVPSVAKFADASEALALALPSREDVLEGTVPQDLLPMRYNRRGPALAMGDIDGDGTDEIVIGGTTRDPARVLHRDGNRFSSVSVPALATPPPINDGPVLVFDADGDGKNDLLITAGGAALPADEPEYQPRLFLNDGHGGLQMAAKSMLPELRVSVGAVAAADYDHDGRLDIFIGGRVVPGFYPEAPTSALLQNRLGGFVDVTEALAPGLHEIGMVTSAVWSDVDGDGWVDLIVALEWGGIHYFHNDGGRRFEDWSERAGFSAAGAGWWNSLATADFNGDGRPDFVAGNLGLNTPFRASREQPVMLYNGDFAGTGRSQIVEAYEENGKLYPRRSRGELGAKIPEILRRFPTVDSFARATLAEIFGADRLAAAKKLSATELRSGVFLSSVDGTYRFEPLPRIAQIAPVQGVVAGDFDGDGRADICMVQNSYAPVPSTGRFDGGLGQLLRGTGVGTFEPVPTAGSGLVVGGDAKGLVVTDLDGDAWPDFVVTRNNQTSLAYRNSGCGGRLALKVRLHGRGGNPDAVGARVTAERADGSTVTSEILAGGGFGSQSTTTCFFFYESSNPVREIRVRWPRGATSGQRVDAGVLTVEPVEPP